MPGRKPTAKQLEVFRTNLDQLRQVLNGDINRLEQDAFGLDGEKGGVDARADDGSDSFSMEFSLELMRMDGDALRRIDDALARIDDGSFGRCVGCEAWIAKGRLDAMPYAETCIECQRAQESGSA